MNALRLFAGLALVTVAGGLHAQQSCAPSNGQTFVCGPKNPEDLVLVPGTQSIISSGMAEGAGFYLVDARSGEWSALSFTAQHDAAFAACATPPSPQSKHARLEHPRDGAGARASERRRPRSA